jgi:hypothetical protein
MKASPAYPSLYQINTRVWLTELSRSLGRAATLDDIPDAELDRVAGMGSSWHAAPGRSGRRRGAAHSPCPAADDLKANKTTHRSREMILRHRKRRHVLLVVAALTLASMMIAGAAQAADKRPNIVMLMTDDTGWNDFGAYSGGGAGLGHPTPKIDRIAQEGAVFTSWYGQASCTAGRASFITGRIPIRTALSVVIVPGDENFLRKETPTIAEFFKKNGYQTYFSGKWHLGDKPEGYPIALVQRDVREGILRRREHVRVGRRGRPAGQESRGNHLGLFGDL